MKHLVFDRDLNDDIRSGEQSIVVAMGCFWGAEKLFFNTTGVTLTMVGYAGGNTVEPTYEQTCSGLTGHTEVVKIVFDASVISLHQLLDLFWKNHDPTQGDRQGNDIGSQYRSAIYCDNEQLQCVKDSGDNYQQLLNANGFSAITTEIKTDQIFYSAEAYHQQYLRRVPNGYCGLKGLNI
jgi:peptide-methionine (S)-S-oxide reductase